VHALHTRTRARIHTHTHTHTHTHPAGASNPSGGHCCQTYWGLFLRQPEGRGGGGDDERGDGGRWSGGWFEGGGPRKGGGGGWLALLICKTANLRTLLTRALLFVLHILYHCLLFLRRTYSHFLAFTSIPLSLSLSIYLSRLTHFGSISLPSSRVLLGPCKHAHQSTLSLSRFRQSLPSHLPAFPHPCGTSRKLYVPTLATLNAGLAGDNPRPSPPPPLPPGSPVVLPISATLSPAPFSLLADGPPGFTTS